MSPVKNDAAWADHFIERRLVNPADLHAHPLNWRTHPPGQRAALEGSLEELGWVDEIRVNANTMTIFNGHLRRDTAIAHGLTAVPASFYDLTDDEETQAILYFDTVTRLFEIHQANLDALIGDAPTRNAALQGLLDSISAREQAVIDAATKPQPDGPVPFRTILVSIANDADRDALAALLGLSLTRETHTAWYPA